jgi:hypothetical protein
VCRSDVTEQAGPALARLLGELRDALCAETGDDPALTLIGPVDFGEPEALPRPPAP